MTLITNLQSFTMSDSSKLKKFDFKLLDFPLKTQSVTSLLWELLKVGNIGVEW